MFLFLNFSLLWEILYGIYFRDVKKKHLTNTVKITLTY